MFLKFICSNPMVSSTQTENIYGFNVLDANGDEISLREFEGKVLLINNSVAECGFTPQYDELQDMYEK